MDPTTVVIGFVVLLAALLYVMYKDQGKRQTAREPIIEEREPAVIKASDCEAEVVAEKPGPEPVHGQAATEAPAEGGEEGLESLSGVGEKYRALLRAAGVETIPALAKWDAEDLYEKLMEVNEGQMMVKRPPPLATVKDWVKRAGARTG
jgi:predicted flap endonuclease-1-like 5' DNA nuclease